MNGDQKDRTSERSSNCRIVIVITLLFVAAGSAFAGYLYGHYREAVRLAQWEIVYSGQRLQRARQSPQALAEQLDLDAQIALKQSAFTLQHPWRYLAGSFRFDFPPAKTLEWHSNLLRPAAERFEQQRLQPAK